MTEPDKIFDAQAFAHALRVRAAERGISGRDAAKEIGVSAATYSRIARGHEPTVTSYLLIKRWIETESDQ